MQFSGKRYIELVGQSDFGSWMKEPGWRELNGGICKEDKSSGLESVPNNDLVICLCCYLHCMFDYSNSRTHFQCGNFGKQLKLLCIPCLCFFSSCVVFLKNLETVPVLFSLFIGSFPVFAQSARKLELCKPPKIS